MKKFNGAYPKDVKLLKDPILSKRVKSLLKNRFFFLKNTWAVETPINIKNNNFIAWGCQEHNCSDTNFIIVVDFTKNVVYVGIREEEQVKIYSEDGTKNTEITNWSNRTN
ncbi:hypothetical protein [Pedobacter psychrodurus]|uniref:hypothetical protein n=1 Tax=Pedobacter psychrodurus TaxID=2530456 RepID=UPI00197D1955|nr:hypothetical protein [Pedobacter psychrodurus]